jgi:hypothetical protein
VCGGLQNVAKPIKELIKVLVMDKRYNNLVFVCFFVGTKL